MYTIRETDFSKSNSFLYIYVACSLEQVLIYIGIGTRYNLWSSLEGHCVVYMYTCGRVWPAIIFVDWAVLFSKHVTACKNRRLTWCGNYWPNARVFPYNSNTHHNDQ